MFSVEHAAMILLIVVLEPLIYVLTDPSSRRLQNRTAPKTTEPTLDRLQWAMLWALGLIAISLVLLPLALPWGSTWSGATPESVFSLAFLAGLSLMQSLGLAIVANFPSQYRNTVRYLGAAVFSLLVWALFAALYEDNALTPLGAAVAIFVAVGVSLTDHLASLSSQADTAATR
jgi:hypothetical protein